MAVTCRSTGKSADLRGLSFLEAKDCAVFRDIQLLFGGCLPTRCRWEKWWWACSLFPSSMMTFTINTTLSTINRTCGTSLAYCVDNLQFQIPGFVSLRPCVSQCHRCDGLRKNPSSKRNFTIPRLHPLKTRFPDQFHFITES